MCVGGFGLGGVGLGGWRPSASARPILRDNRELRCSRLSLFVGSTLKGARLELVLLKFIAASIVESRSVYCHRVRYFYQRIGVAIQSGNADIITVWRRNIAAPAPAVAPAAHGGV